MANSRKKVKIVLSILIPLILIFCLFSACLTALSLGADFLFLGTYTLFRPRMVVVNGSSMEGTLKDGDYLFSVGTALTYDPKQGDIVVIKGNFEGDYYDRPIVKRVIATGGQTVRIQYYEDMDALVYVDDELYEVPTDVYLDHNVYNNASALQEYEYYYLNYNPDGTAREGFTPNPNYDWENKVYEVTVPEGHCFVMGDNRYNSADSRLNEIGCVPNKYVKSKILFKVFPFEPLYND